MRLFEAVILFLVGMLGGVLVTLVDVYAIGSASFLTKLSLWVLLNVLFAANVRRRDAAILGAIPLNLGFVECYYLMCSFTFAGLARSAMVPLALLSLLAAAVALVVWTAKSERGPLGLSLSVLIAVATLVACVIANERVTFLDLVAVAAMLVMLVREPSLMLDVMPAGTSATVADATSRRRALEAGAAEAADVAARTTRRAASAIRRALPPAAGHPSDKSSGAGTGSSSRSSGGTSSRRTDQRTDQRSGQRTDRGEAGRKQGNRSQDSQEQTKRPMTKRPTRRVGGAVPDARRIRPTRAEEGQRNARVQGGRSRSRGSSSRGGRGGRGASRQGSAQRARGERRG